MELLHGAASLLQVGQALPQPGKLTLLIQALEALAYLHRRGVLHHDLKPENILVADGRVRLLDFGLSVLAAQQRDNDAFGTVLYLAPEVLDGQAYTEAADLYSLGVVAYELLVGVHPFPAETVAQYFEQVFHRPPDLRGLFDSPALAQVIAQLLAKTPAERPASAQAAIAALCAAVGLPAQISDTAIRESYLQAAAFVGRERELRQLTAALERARMCQGNACLIGGESGVGKSRLLDELRTLALVDGFTVLRGQAVTDGGSPFQLWRELVRHLALTTPLEALEASVLKEIIPDLERLLGHPVPDAPPLRSGAQQRMIRFSDILSLTVLISWMSRRSRSAILGVYRSHIRGDFPAKGADRWLNMSVNGYGTTKLQVSWPGAFKANLRVSSANSLLCRPGMVLGSCRPRRLSPSIKTTWCARLAWTWSESSMAFSRAA